MTDIKTRPRFVAALMLTALASVAFSAVAQTATGQAGVSESEAHAQAPEARDQSDSKQTAKPEALLSDRNCLRQTGSRITAQANARADMRKQKGEAGRKCAPVSGRSYSRDDIDQTGAIDLADALRRLDPSIH